MCFQAEGAKKPESNTAPQSSISDLSAEILTRSNRIGAIRASLNTYDSTSAR